MLRAGRQGETVVYFLTARGKNVESAFPPSLICLLWYMPADRRDEMCRNTARPGRLSKQSDFVPIPMEALDVGL